MFLFFFFFSSRRRHTRLQGDWSSDVCSSDLYPVRGGVCAARLSRLCDSSAGTRRSSAILGGERNWLWRALSHSDSSSGGLPKPRLHCARVSGHGEPGGRISFLAHVS